MKKNSRSFRLSALLAACASFATLAPAQDIWTGSGADQNWSTPGNWPAGAVPGAATNVVFTNNVGAPTVAGTVDNIVDSSFTSPIASLFFSNTNISGAGAYHTTQIGAGQTLTILGGLTIGTTPDIANSQLYASFAGAGTLMMSNLTSDLIVSQGDTGNGAQASLNLTNLNTFNATLGGIVVGVYNTPCPSVARQKGYLYLAKTNILNIIGKSSRAYGNEGQIEIGENLGNGSNIQVPMYLGISNEIFVNSISVGGDKQGSGALIAFNPVFTNGTPTPAAYFRGTNGASTRVSIWKAGDNSNQSSTGSSCSGTVDFSNGSLDAMVDMLILGEGDSGAGTDSSSGTFTFSAGVANVNTLYLGYRNNAGAQTSHPSGTMNVNGTANLIVNNAICLSYNGGGTGGYASGTLNINGGSVMANTVTNGVSGAANSTANIFLTGGTLGITSLSGSIGTLAAPIINLSMSGSTLQLQASSFQTNVETVNLTLAGAANMIDLTYLPPVTTYPVTYAVLNASAGLPTLNFSVSFPTASPMYQGFISNSANTVYVVVTNGPTLGSTIDVWTGQNGSNWDTGTINWSSFGNPTTYANGEPTVFNDNATGPTNINLTTSLLPASILVSNSILEYIFSGAGSISGSATLTKDGSASLLVTNSGINSFLGSVTINGGTVQFGAGSTNGNLPPLAAVTNNGVLIFDRSDNLVVPNVISGAGTLAQNGNGVVTISASNSFSGATMVNSGTLLLNGYLSGSLSNALSTTIGGSGTDLGSVTVGGTLRPSVASGTPSTFTMGGNLTLLSGAMLVFDLNGANNGVGGGVNDLITAGGNFVVNNNTVSLNFSGVPVSGTTYTLVNFSGMQMGSLNSAIGGTHFTVSLSQGSSPVTATLSGSGGSLKWDSTSNAVWDLGTTSNWFNLGTSLQDVFYQGDNVLFDDSVTGVVTNIVVASGVSVSPTSVTVNASSHNYMISGPGQISGNGSILKEGSGTLTINNADPNFTGTATVAGGTLRAGGGTAIGTAGTVVATNGGTFDFAGQGIGEVPIIVAGAGVGGNGAIVNSGADQIHAVNTVELSADATFGGPGRWDIRVNGSQNASLTTTDSLSHNITKVGTNQIALVTCTIDPSIGNIDIQGGEFSLQLIGTSQNSGGWFGDTTHSITIENGATLEFDTLSSAYPIYRTIMMNNGSTIVSDGGDNGIAGSIVLSGNDTFNVVSGGSPYLLVTGTISGSGNLIVNGTVPLNLYTANIYTGDTLINAGILSLGSTGSISTSSNIIIAANAILDPSQRVDQTLTLASGQTLQGNGTVTGILVVGAGATVSAGTNSTNPGALTVTNGVTLGGNTLMKLSPVTATNDVLIASDGTSITYGGTLTLVNVGGSYSVGNSFQLFNAASYSGEFTSIVPSTPGNGLAWDTNDLASGVLTVMAGTGVPQPGITSITLSGTSLVINGTNGLAGEKYNLLTTTNLTMPLGAWTVLPTNTFTAGTFSITNTVSPGASSRFYAIRVP